MKLEVGMYVRTLNGMIAKIISKKDVSGSLHREEIVFILDNGNRLALHSKKVVKSSHNIIDLIKVGDYVNGEKVLETNCKWEYMDDDSDTGVNEVYDGLELQKGRIYFEYEIETVVTKEQMEQMAYKVGE